MHELLQIEYLRPLEQLEYAGFIFHFNLSVVSLADPLDDVTLASSYEHLMGVLSDQSVSLNDNRLVASCSIIYHV